MLEAVVHAVGDGAVVVERGEDFLDLAHDVVGAGDVEEGFLLAGEAGVRQVFGGGRGAHGHRDVAAAVLGAQLARRRSRMSASRSGCSGASITQPRISRAGRGRARARPRRPAWPAVEDALVQVVVGDEGLEGVGGGGDSRRAPRRRASPGCRSSRRARNSCRPPGPGRSGAGRAATGCWRSRRGLRHRRRGERQAQAAPARSAVFYNAPRVAHTPAHGPMHAPGLLRLRRHRHHRRDHRPQPADPVRRHRVSTPTAFPSSTPRRRPGEAADRIRAAGEARRARGPIVVNSCVDSELYRDPGRERRR